MTISSIQKTVPATADDGSYYYDRFSQEGEFVETEWADPAHVLQQIGNLREAASLKTAVANPLKMG
jgi:hypothetical protein